MSKRPRILIDFVDWPTDSLWKYPDSYLWAKNPMHTRGFWDDELVFHNSNVTDASAFEKIDHLSNAKIGDEIWVETPDIFYSDDPEEKIPVWRKCKVIGLETLSKDD